MLKYANSYMLVPLALIICAMLAGCGAMRTRHRSSSVVQYLYPDKNEYIETPGIPRMELPLRVGVAFVPEKTGS